MEVVVVVVVVEGEGGVGEWGERGRKEGCRRREEEGGEG